jgi:MFS family permease
MDSGAGRGRNWVFAAACMGMLLFGVVFLSLGSVNNMLAERFHLDNNGIGTLTALLPLGILAGSLVFGPIVDSFGYKWMLIVCSLLVLAGLEGLAFAAGQGWVRFFVFLVGFGGGVLNGATNALASDVSPGRRGASLSLLGVFFGIGALGMPGTLAFLSRSCSVSSIVAGIGAAVLLPVVYFALIRFPPPKQRARGLPAGEILRLLREPAFLFAGPALAVQSGMEGMSNDWTTRYFKTVVLAPSKPGGDSEFRTLLGLMALTGAMVVTRAALGFLLKRVPAQGVLFGSIAIAAAGAVLLKFGGGYATALGAAVLIGCGLAACFPVVLGWIGDLYPDRSGTAFSAVFVVALLGNMSINKTLGYVAQHSQSGVSHYTSLMFVCLGLSAILLALVSKYSHTRCATKKQQ